MKMHRHVWSVIVPVGLACEVLAYYERKGNTLSQWVWGLQQKHLTTKWLSIFVLTYVYSHLAFQRPYHLHKPGR